MRRDLTAALDITVQSSSRFVFILAAAARPAVESLRVVHEGSIEIHPTELVEPDGTRVHSLHAPAGRLRLDYSATLTENELGSSANAGSAGSSADAAELEVVRYLRPSRYCQSDALLPTAAAEFSGLQGADLLLAVRHWVNRQLSYVPGSSRPTDGAIDTMLGRAGVCRDYAHLVIALLRAMDVPARLAAVYAPGLSPMDFHAVAEAYVDGTWYVIDATGMAPRQQMVRIATGRDAADTAFMSAYTGRSLLQRVTVTAVADTLSYDNPEELAQLP
jgi:transglutaminase-like putative cysteine protease